ncbi:hypothetical protein C1G86_0979 [Dehalococcoides mccartyi]|jgi:hypothetical protein|uniref:Uncharacterized protein n=1 Tax=Dehalococcoides mccartyi TaxID=61435 RepID=A0A142VA90_9CHLR|nr:hypothetical protein dcmb_961 [Dehalococcoides mccartyi DCMB5]AGG08056.1 hypothetical protein btf_978 [Dehalococcoides mccartyi BTF08]AHB13682.1 hypothetical protein GY50_0909 [Dehalococcoides mccartyi GY50]AII58699.1 hypothetical protein X792_04705 [Dehalococcoides mccartyi CG1]AII61655.1 hypothetical protein X794_04490 [Dehalococcoides mccartyi CG5]AMU86754.1 hypothetical protein Dm11a5_0928 [Dehalococcoides mccartyi]
MSKLIENAGVIAFILAFLFCCFGISLVIFYGFLYMPPAITPIS